MFNENPLIQSVPLFDGHECLVVDNALTDPWRWVEYAETHRAKFEPSRYAYPGLEMWMPEDVTMPIDTLFMQHFRSRLNLRRTLQRSSRLSIVTQAPHELQPRQWTCHRDNTGMPPGQTMAASVLYLFEDPALGGTSFFRPRRPMPEVEGLVKALGTLAPERVREMHPEVVPGYLVDSNDWFERVCTVPARFNRLTFYDGGLFHSGDIRHPERMLPDPRRGRLTLNAFFTCRRNAA